MTVQKEDDNSIMYERVETPQDFKWVVRCGTDDDLFDSWTGAQEHLVSEIRFWIGYYTVQVEEAQATGLTWTVDNYKGFLEDYYRWEEYLQTIEEDPQRVYFIGGNRKFTITTRNKDAEHSSARSNLLESGSG